MIFQNDRLFHRLALSHKMTGGLAGFLKKFTGWTGFDFPVVKRALPNNLAGEIGKSPDSFCRGAGKTTFIIEAV